MATVTITYQSEDDVKNFDINQYGTVTSRTGVTPTPGFPDVNTDPRQRQTVLVLNSGSITLVEIQRALKAAGVKATAV